jgi:hypothetical protein
MRRHKAAALSLLRQRLHQRKQATRHVVYDARAAAGQQQQQAVPGAELQSQELPEGSHFPDTERATVLPTICPSRPATPAQPVPASQRDSCSSSEAGTPFGTPMHILPSHLLQRPQGGQGEPDAHGGCMAGADVGGASQAGQGVGLAAEGMEREPAPPLLSAAASQGDPGDGEPSFFQVE